MLWIHPNILCIKHYISINVRKAINISDWRRMVMFCIAFYIQEDVYVSTKDTTHTLRDENWGFFLNCSRYCLHWYLSSHKELQTHVQPNDVRLLSLSCVHICKSTVSVYVRVSINLINWTANHLKYLQFQVAECTSLRWPLGQGAAWTCRFE